MVCLMVWLGIGLVSSLASVYVFRRNSKSIAVRDLYLAVIGSFLGPIVLAMLIIDFLKTSKGE